MALERRRRLRLGSLAATVVLAGTIVWSHARTAVDPVVWDGRSGRVVGVIDANTIAVSGLTAADEPVRLLGVEASDDAAATDFLNHNVLGSLVTLKFDGTEHRNASGHALAYVYPESVDGPAGDSVNLDLVRRGLAFAYRPFKHAQAPTFEQAEQQARARGVGYWKSPADHVQPQWRRDWLKSLRGNGQ